MTANTVADSAVRGARLPRGGAPAAAARRRAGGVRRAGLPRRRDGRDRRPGRRQQAGALPALPGQARPLPRAARPSTPTRWWPAVREALDSTPDNKQRVGRDHRGLLRLRRRRRRGVPAGLRVRPDATSRRCASGSTGSTQPVRRRDLRDDRRGHRAVRRRGAPAGGGAGRHGPGLGALLAGRSRHRSRATRPTRCWPRCRGAASAGSPGRPDRPSLVAVRAARTRTARWPRAH